MMIRVDVRERSMNRWVIWIVETDNRSSRLETPTTNYQLLITSHDATKTILSFTIPLSSPWGGFDCLQVAENHVPTHDECNLKNARLIIRRKLWTTRSHVKCCDRPPRRLSAISLCSSVYEQVTWLRKRSKLNCKWIIIVSTHCGWKVSAKRSKRMLE